MASPSERTRNNVRAGIFESVTIALAAVTIVVLSDLSQSLFGSRRNYTVTFNVSDGIKNLKSGSEVRIGGVLMGRVETVRPRVVTGGAFTLIDVDFELDAQITLYQEARIVISSALIGSEAWLEIYSVGDPALGEPPDGQFSGISAPGSLAALLGPDNADKASQMIDDLKVSTGNVRDLTTRVSKEDWPRWASRIDDVMTWASEATVKIDAVLDEGHGFLVDTRGVVKENREGIKTIVSYVESGSENLDAIMSTVRNETVAKVHKLLDTGQTGLAQAVDVLESLRNDYEVWAADITETMAGARLTAQQLKLASIEVRRSPWKLLYRPTRTEMEHELLYEAARSFALAGSDLKASSDSARRIIDRYRDELDDETAKELNDFLRDSLHRYSNAQERLLDVLVTD